MQRRRRRYICAIVLGYRRMFHIKWAAGTVALHLLHFPANFICNVYVAAKRTARALICEIAARERIIEFAEGVTDCR